MAEARPFCFVIMPFRPELNYFYLYLKRYIEEQHNIDCERGDAQILTKPLLEKIADYIRRADVLIADCTGRNANVFYELGLAHANDKKVILISQDAVDKAPADIRHFEFIRYNLGDHAAFMAQLDNALRNVFSDRYAKLYDDAIGIFTQFRKETGSKVLAASRDLFVSRVSAVERTRQRPIDEDDTEKTEILLPRIIADSGDVQVMMEITRWLTGLSDHAGAAQ